MAVLDAARSRVAELQLRILPLGTEINAFARWFEDGACADRVEALRIRVGKASVTLFRCLCRSQTGDVEIIGLLE